MNSILFPAFKFLSLDYEHENFMKQKLATSWMLVPFPKEILKEEEYCHSNIFVNDLYRTPWKRSITVCKVDGEDSVTDVWKTYAAFTDILETKSTFNKEKSFDIVPSSNPSSQTDLEVRSAAELYVSEDKHDHEECWKTIPPTALEDYLLPEETMFVDHVVQFGWHVPRLRFLLPRLKTFPIQDPIVDWQRNVPEMEMFFRINTSKEENLKPNMFLEEFHVLPPSIEEHCLSLPCTLELNEHSTPYKSAASELITVLQLVPEEMLEDATTNTTGLFTKIYAENDVIERNTIPRNVDPCKEEDVEEAVSFRSYHDYELEIPITLPCAKPKDAINKNRITLTAEELSPVSTTFHSSDADKDILESLGSPSAVQTLLLKVPLTKNKSEHLTTEEVKCRISINPDTSVDLILDEDWSKLGSNMGNPNIVEQVKINDQSTENLNSTEIESFKTIIISNKLERIFEKKISSIRPQISIHKWSKQSSCNVSAVINPSSTQNNVIFMDACKNTDVSTGDDITVVTHGQKTDQPKVSLPLFKHDKLKQYLTPTKEILSATDGSQASSTQQQYSNSYKSLDGGISVQDTVTKEDGDLLSNFIALRTRNTSDHSEDNVLSQANDEQKIRSSNKENVVFCNVISESLPEEPKHQAIRVHVTPSGQQGDDLQRMMSTRKGINASQQHAYRVLQTAAEPVLKKLVCLEVFASMEWNFTSVSFDCTRFLLRKQEKIISDSRKLGNKSDKDEMIFKNAALLHILVTLRDLILMCSLDATLEYLCKAQEKYKSVFGPYLHDIWRKLRIVQFVREKAEEPNPKIAALLKWMEKSNVEYKHLKVLILSQRNSKTITEHLNNIFSKTGGLRAIGLYPASGNTFLQTKEVLDSLTSYSCVISKNQYIGSDFPWAHFSLVVEYDCTDYWLQLCRKLNVSHITLKTSVPDIQKHDDHQHKIYVPYVLLTSEIINNSELLRILESRHNMCFFERSSNRSLHLFARKSQCTIITVDVSTVIIIQELEEIKHDKSAENLILKLVALSLQYSCCWVLLYQKKSNQSDLSGDILHGICLIYAAIIPFTAKSEDVEIKVLISSGVDATASLIHRILDYTLMLCKSDPYKWLDRSWLSPLISETEKVLLSFPCINPMVAQLLLCRGSSLQWLLSATPDQLKELFPDVPSKVLKHFSDITALHQLSLSASSARLSQTSTRVKHTVAAQEHPTNVDSPCVSNKILQSDILQCKANTLNADESSLSFQKSQSKNTKSQPLSSVIHTVKCYKRSTTSTPPEMSDQTCCSNTDFGTRSKILKRWIWSANGTEQHSHQSACLQDNTVDRPFHSGQHSLMHRVSYQSNPTYKTYVQEPNFSISQESIYADLLSKQNSTNPSYCGNELTNAVSQPLPSEKQAALLHQTQEKFCSHFFTVSSNKETSDAYYSRSGIAGKRRITMDDMMTLEAMSAATDKDFTELSQLKRKKLSYEKVPGRSDGQTRLKFF